jgi:signal transduction histidine kinase
MAGEDVHGEEAEIERSDGTRRSVLINAAPIRNARGEIVAGVGTISDISEEKKRERAAHFLDEISRQLASSLDYEATIQSILGLLVPRIADLVSIHHRRDDLMVRRSAAAASDPRINRLFQQADDEFPLPLPSVDPVAVAIRTGKAQLREAVDDELLKAIARDERQLQWLRSLGLQSAMVVPLTVRGKTIGALRIVSVTPRHRYTCDDLAFAEEIARRAALAIDNAQLFHKVTEAGKVARFLAEASHSLSSSLEYEEVLNRITRLAVPFFADFAMAHLKDGNGSAHHVASAHRDSGKDQLLAEAARLYRPDPSNKLCTVTRALSTGEPVLMERVTAELLDGQGFTPRVRELIGELAPVSWMTVPLVARDETLGTIVFASVDDRRRYEEDDLRLGQTIASRVALAMQNAKLYKKVQNALTTRDEVLAIVSHDLRNPLHTIGMTVQLLEDVPLEDIERKRHLGLIGRAKDRMNRLIQDLLDVTRVEAGQSLIIEPRPERPSAMIPEAVESFVTSAQEKNVELDYRVPEQIADVLVDRGRILQVLSNLIGNALKFTPEGGRIEVNAVQQDGVVLISVRDSGPGIPAEDQEKIFHPFWSAPRAARLGAGLGLTISRGIVQQHGGRLWVESREGAGSKFLFTLPAAPAQTTSMAAD